MKSIPIIILCLLTACGPKEPPKEELYINVIQTIAKPGAVTATTDSLSVLNSDNLEIDLTLFENNPGTDSVWYEATHPMTDIVKEDSTMVTGYLKLSDAAHSPLHFKGAKDLVDRLSKFGYDKVSDEKVEYPNGQAGMRFKFRKR